MLESPETISSSNRDDFCEDVPATQDAPETYYSDGYSCEIQCQQILSQDPLRLRFSVARPNGSGGLEFLFPDSVYPHKQACDPTDFGNEGDQVFAGDWDHDGDTDIGVARNNGSGGLTFYLDSNGDRQWTGADTSVNFGLANDKVVIGDWDRDGYIDDVGVTRANGGGLDFYLDSNGNYLWNGGTDAYFGFGSAGDSAIAGDWDGDGKADDVGVTRASGGTLSFYLDSNGNNRWDGGTDVAFDFGSAGDRPIVGDWNDDGTSKIGIVRNLAGYGLLIFLDSDGDHASDATDYQATYLNSSGDFALFGTWY